MWKVRIFTSLSEVGPSLCRFQEIGSHLVPGIGCIEFYASWTKKVENGAKFLDVVK
jgi:hypothetical protein